MAHPVEGGLLKSPAALCVTETKVEAQEQAGKQEGGRCPGGTRGAGMCYDMNITHTHLYINRLSTATTGTRSPDFRVGGTAESPSSWTQSRTWGHCGAEEGLSPQVTAGSFIQQTIVSTSSAPGAVPEAGDIALCRQVCPSGPGLWGQARLVPQARRQTRRERSP